MSLPFINFQKNKTTYLFGQIIRHITIAPIITSYLAKYKYPDHGGILYTCGGLINLSLLTAAFTTTMALLHTKYHKLDLSTTIALPITFFISSLILGTIGFFYGMAARAELEINQNKYQQAPLTNQEENRIRNEYQSIYATLVNFFPILFLGLFIDKTIEVGNYLYQVGVEKLQFERSV